MAIGNHPAHRERADLDTSDEFYDSGSVSGRPMKTRHLLLDLLARWHWIALGLVLGVLGSAYYLSKAPKKYSATATLLIKQQTSAVISKDQIEELDMRSIEGLNTVAERINRLDLLDRVAARMDVRTLPGLMPPAVDWTPKWMRDSLGRKAATKGASSQQVPAPSALGGMIGSWMKISIRRGTRLLDVTFQHEVPEVSKALADAVVREYLSEIAGAMTAGRSTKTDTLLRRSEEARIKLQSAESAMANYTRALDLHKTLDEREVVVAQLARRYLPKHPKLITANADLEDIKTRFLQEFQVAISSPSDEAFWKTADSEIETTKDDPAAHLRIARQSLLARTGVLKGEIVSQMSVFNAMLTRIEESNVNREGEETNADVSSYARVPGEPSFPNPNKTYLQGSMGGLAAGLILSFILMRQNDKYDSVAQVEDETGLPVLAAIPEIEIRHINQVIRSHKSRSSKRVEQVFTSPLQDAWDPRLIFRQSTSSSTFAETFRILRASVSLLGDESKRKITLFSSALPGEGKSLISANFALAAAGQGNKTLLIDIDLRKPSLHRIFGLLRAERGAGITEWLAGQAKFDEVIQRNVGAENLHVLFTGERAPNPGELLNVPRLEQLFAEALAHYDLIVVDSAPLLAVPDTRIIVPFVDNFCLVVRANYAPKGAVARTLELLATAGTTPSGLVLNGYKEKRRLIGQNYSYGSYRLNRYGRAYQYGYGSYGSYGSDEDDEKEEMEISKRKMNRKNKAKAASE